MCTHDGGATWNPVTGSHTVVLRFGNDQLGLLCLLRQTQTINISKTQLHTNSLGSLPTDFSMNVHKIIALMS